MPAFSLCKRGSAVDLGTWSPAKLVGALEQRSKTTVPFKHVRFVFLKLIQPGLWYEAGMTHEKCAVELEVLYFNLELIVVDQVVDLFCWVRRLDGPSAPFFVARKILELASIRQ